MKNDFAQIYPEEMTKAEQQYVPVEVEEEEVEELAPAA